MKKIIIMVTVLLLTIGIAYAQTAPEEEDYKDMDKLHNKIVRMKREMDRLIKDMVSVYPEYGKTTFVGYGEDIKVDITENDKDVMVKADLPGMDKDKIDITLEKNRILKIKGTREVEKLEQAPGTVKQERGRGSFERILELPSECKSEGIKADYKNGVLELVIPKKKESREEKVKIKVQ